MPRWRRVASRHLLIVYVTPRSTSTTLRCTRFRVASTPWRSSTRRSLSATTWRRRSARSSKWVFLSPFTADPPAGGPRRHPSVPDGRAGDSGHLRPSGGGGAVVPRRQAQSDRSDEPSLRRRSCRCSRRCPRSSSSRCSSRRQRATARWWWRRTSRRPRSPSTAWST